MRIQSEILKIMRLFHSDDQKTPCKKKEKQHGKLPPKRTKNDADDNPWRQCMNMQNECINIMVELSFSKSSTFAL